MAFVVLLACCLGFLLNEEQALRRICRNMSYSHEGWLILRNNFVLGVFGGCCLLSFTKALIWSKLVITSYPEYACLAVAAYSFATILAVRGCQGFYYTPWLTLLGLGAALEPLLFQLPCTAFCVIIILWRNFASAVNGAILAGALACCFLPGLIWTVSFLGLLYGTWFFSGRQSPITARQIKYW